MKTRITVLTLVLGPIIFLTCCASVPKSPEYQLTGLYVTMDAEQMSGTPKNHAKLGVGDTMVIYARGMSSRATGQKWFILPSDVEVDWSADEALEVIPTEGHKVTLRVVKPISNEAKVSAFTVITRVTKIDGDNVSMLFESISEDFTVEGK
jgi:hypothetical protein